MSFDFNNGAVLTTFTAPFGGGLNITAGNFTTDGSGVLLSVMSSWTDDSVGSDYSSNSGTPNAWRIFSALAAIYSGSSGGVDIARTTLLTPGGWQAVADAPVPEPSSLALLAMGAAGGF